MEFHNPQDRYKDGISSPRTMSNRGEGIDDPLSRRLGTNGVAQSTGKVQRGHFQSKNHVKPLWRSKTTLIIVKNGTINNVKITFSVKSAFFIDAFFRADRGLMQ
eukprot:scaffold207812_cov72-Attheya_sp.AAC.1